MFLNEVSPRLFNYIMKCNFFCDVKAEFLAAITPVVSVWQYADLLKKYFLSTLKTHISGFFDKYKFWKEQNWSEIDFFCSILNIFTDNCNQFNGSFKSSNFFFYFFLFTDPKTFEQ